MDSNFINNEQLRIKKSYNLQSTTAFSPSLMERGAGGEVKN